MKFHQYAILFLLLISIVPNKTNASSLFCQRTLQPIDLKSEVTEDHEEMPKFSKSLQTTHSALELLKQRLNRVVHKGAYGMSQIDFVPGVVLFQFETQRELARTFLRFQERYESPNPEFRGGVFGLGEFKSWYNTTRSHGRFSYFTDWGGFNFPSHIAQAFIDGEFPNITARERQIIEVLQNRAGEKYYVIGGYGDLSNSAQLGNYLSTLQHEVGHSFFYRLPEYRKNVETILKTLDLKTVRSMNKYLKEMGYCDAVLKDEIHAYFLSGWDEMVMDGVIELKPNRRAIQKLSSLFLKTLREELARNNLVL